MICQLKKPDVPWVAVRPKIDGIPCNIDIDTWLDGNFAEYSHFLDSIWWCWFLLVFLCVFYLIGFIRYIFWPEEALKELCGLFIYFVIFLCRIPVYIAIYYLMQIKNQVVDHPPDAIEQAETMELIAFLFAFIIDNIYNPYEVAKLFFKDH